MKPDDFAAIEEATEDWVWDIINYAALAAGEAYAAGEMYAYGKLKMGISFDKTKSAAVQYAEAYKKRLVETGTIDISVPIVNYAGDIIGRKTEPYKWLTNKSVAMRNEIADIIERGVAEGIPTGIKQSSTGRYPANTIASQLQDYFDRYKSDAARIARTETGRCYVAGETMVYEEAGVEYVKYLGAPDACEMCQPYIGQIFSLGSEPPLPIHPFCRCNYAPYYPESGERVKTFYNINQGMPWREVYEDIYDLPACIMAAGPNTACV